MSIGLLGQKIGMTSVYDAKGRLRPVTVIAAGDNVLLRRLTARTTAIRRCKSGSARKRNRA
jgi:ribosomal protein L3